jgi:ABC-2 type transport system permease protein
MTSPSDAVPEADAAAPPAAQSAAPAVISPMQRFYWSVRRELWESRSVFIAPIVVAALFLLGFLISTRSLPRKFAEISALDPEQQAARLALPFEISAMALIVISIIVGMFYCLGALHNERRDRSVLFWKSLPVSDLTVVLSKAFVPLAILPAVTFVVVLATHVIMLVWSTLVLLANGFSVGMMWTGVPLLQIDVVVLYGVVVLALWQAPIYGWLLLVSGWAKRAPFLWAILPPAGLCLVEGVAFESSHVAHTIGGRLFGVVDQAFDFHVPGVALDPLRALDPVRFLSGPDLWLGLVTTAGFLAASVWLRRRREPI